MIYLDSDGLFAGYMPRLLSRYCGGLTKQEFNALPREKQTEIMRKAYREEPDFFYSLTPYLEMKEVLLSVERTGLPWAILTAGAQEHPDHEIVVQTKKLWFEVHFGVPRDKVIVTRNSKEKKQYAGLGKMLIDDYSDNCRDWAEHGGTAVKVEGDNPDVCKIIRCIELFAADAITLRSVILKAE
ncbi:MAG: 5' nucleotidase, NT5C type [Shewanella sp.]